MRYLVLEDVEYFDSIDSVIEYCIEEDYHEDDDYFEEWVNDNYDSVTINGETYYPFDIVSNCDSGNYNDLLREYCEAMNEDDEHNARFNLQHGHIGETYNIQQYTVQICEDDYDDGDNDGDDEMPFAPYDENTRRHLVPEEVISNVREQLMENKQIEIEQIIQTEKDENNLMNMLQIVGD